jgi:hypothetical protein
MNRLKFLLWPVLLLVSAQLSFAQDYNLTSGFTVTANWATRAGDVISGHLSWTDPHTGGTWNGDFSTNPVVQTTWGFQSDGGSLTLTSPTGGHFTSSRFSGGQINNPAFYNGMPSNQPGTHLFGMEVGGTETAGVAWGGIAYYDGPGKFLFVQITPNTPCTPLAPPFQLCCCVSP